jgi:hypothetical protein
MKLDKIYSIYRKSSHITLYNAGGGDEDEPQKQYISDGVSVFALENLPVFDEYTLCGLLGVDSEDINVTIGEIENIETALADEDPSDIALNIIPYEFFDYTVMRSLSDNDDRILHFVDTKYLKPFMSDIRFTFWSRNFKDRRCIVIKSGLFVVGVVMPLRFGTVVDDYIGFTQSVYAELQRQRQRSESNA